MPLTAAKNSWNLIRLKGPKYIYAVFGISLPLINMISIRIQRQDLQFSSNEAILVWIVSKQLPLNPKIVAQLI